MKTAFVSLLIIFAGILFLLPACQTDLEEVNRFLPREEVMIERMKGVRILYSDSAIVRVRIEGPVMLRYLDQKEPYEEFPEGVEVDFFEPSGRRQSRLTANYAVRRVAEDEVVVRDSVVWISQNQERLETEELIWDDAAQKVYTQRPVVITTPDKLIFGIGFEADQGFERWRIKAIQGEVEVKDLPD